MQKYIYRYEINTSIMPLIKKNFREFYFQTFWSHLSRAYLHPIN